MLAILETLQPIRLARSRLTRAINLQPVGPVGTVSPTPPTPRKAARDKEQMAPRILRLDSISRPLLPPSRGREFSEFARLVSLNLGRLALQADAFRFDKLDLRLVSPRLRP